MSGKFSLSNERGSKFFDERGSKFRSEKYEKYFIKITTFTRFKKQTSKQTKQNKNKIKQTSKINTYCPSFKTNGNSVF